MGKGEKLWKFTDDDGSFESSAACKIRALYFPLANETVMSSVTADLHGDIKRGQNGFLLAPASRIDLADSRSSRNFWICPGKGAAWSATGVSKDLSAIRRDEVILKAGLLWHEVTRRSKDTGLEAKILSFVPAGGDPVEIMKVDIANTGAGMVKFVPTAAIPMFARSADSLRDHRHVTSLLQRIEVHKFGVITHPTLLFDESGHEPNALSYFVLGWDKDSAGPQYIYRTQEEFCGDGGDLEAPQAVLDGILPKDGAQSGTEPMAGLRFSECGLKPGEGASYIIVMGITDRRAGIGRIIKKFGRPAGVEKALKETREKWLAESRNITIITKDRDFDSWFRWVGIQPVLRRIYGCSFLPDFDYGKGGRGWRDLWQDCLGLTLAGSKDVRGLLINNFAGVRIDGSNATIIGKRLKEFIADRNRISRVWMDHGVWPLVTLELYMNETGDFSILSEEAGYFRDHQVRRGGAIDAGWRGAQGHVLRTRSGKIYKGTIFEHMLVENLVQFFNVGSHNHVRLEDADWNDGLDMAKENGESVAFTSMYGANLARLADILDFNSSSAVAIAEELEILLKKTDYNSVNAKKRMLERYFDAVHPSISGRKARVSSSWLAGDLRAKSEWVLNHVRKTEWLKEGFFNGYYDNKKRRVEGAAGGRVRMMLPSQVFAIMSGAADKRQIRAIMDNAINHLFDKDLKGFRLNTDFGSEAHDLGRAFSFLYGHKENGAVFSHMAVMFAYALYSRGFAEEGWRVLSSIYRMSADTARSKIYPCLPEYFGPDGRGMYSYLTGSASWFVFTMLTQAFGVRGRAGDLLIEPRLTAGQFKDASTISVSRIFAGRRLKISFSNPEKLQWGGYRITGAKLNSRPIPVKSATPPSILSTGNTPHLLIKRDTLLHLPKERAISIDILLGK